MMTLISLAIVVAFVTSWAGTLGLFQVEIWWELATLITIMLLGHWLEMRSIAQARGALSALAELLPDTAERVTGAGTEAVPLSALAVGDIVLVRPGARVPADGVVAEGTADVDESMITGESVSVSKAAGDAVIAGTVAAGGSLRVRVSAVGDETALSGIMRMVAAAQASASREPARPCRPSTSTSNSVSTCGGSCSSRARRFRCSRHRAAGSSTSPRSRARCRPRCSPSTGLRRPP